MHSMMHTWRSEDNLLELVFFLYVGFGHQTLIVRLGGRHI